MNKELIQINKTVINGAEVNSVNARKLHEVLESKQDFSAWIKKRLGEVDALENVDFIKLHKKMELSKTGQVGVEYILSTDIAKEIAMLERNAKGKQVRRYFIEVEKRYKASQAPLGDLYGRLQLQLDAVKDLDKRVKRLEALSDLDGVNEITIIPDKPYCRIGIYLKNRHCELPTRQLALLGKRATRMSLEKGVVIGKEDVKGRPWSYANTYREDVIEEVLRVCGINV